MNKNKNKKGISLIVLVVTIVVIIILMVTVLYNITDGKLFGVANESVFKNDLRVIEEEFEMFVQTKATQSVGKFEIESLNAADEGLMYNTKTDDRETNIYDVIPTAKRGYYGEFEIIKGELYYKGDVEQKLIWAKELGIGIIPYEIVDGVLISANSNLLLLDSTGTVRIPYNVTKIDTGVFNNLEGLTRVIIPGSVKEIGRNAFSNNKSLQEVIMEDGVEIIGEFAFSGCSNLKTIKMANTVTELKVLAFSRCTNLEYINLPDSILQIGDQAFMSCTNLKEIKLPEKLTSLGGGTFSACYNLKKVILSSGLSKIVEGVFTGCTSLNDIDTSKNDNFVFEENGLYSKDYKILYSVTGNPTSIVINPLTEEIKSRCMGSITSIKEIYISKNVKTIGENSAFGSHKLEKLVVDEENQYYASYDNDLYSKNYEIIYKCNKIGDVIIRDGVKEIVRGTFIEAGVTSIELPESLEKISGWATIPAGVNYIYIPKNVTSISFGSFVYLNNIEVSEENEVYKTVNNKYLLSKDGKTLYFVSKNAANINDFPSTIEVLYYYSFYNCDNLEEIILTSKIKQINASAFSNCGKLKKVEIPNTIEKIEGCFSESNNLTEIIIHKKRGEISGEPWGAVYGARVIKYDE